MKIKTSELTGAALDWKVWELAGGPAAYPKMVGAAFLRAWRGNSVKYLHPSTDWAQGGPIIEREHIGFEWMVSEWMAGQNYGGHPYKDRPDLRPIGTRFMSYGPTPLIAAMRCFVASKLGDEVDVPEELPK